MKLPPLRMPCEVEQPPTTFATTKGYSVRIIDGSVWRVKPLKKLCHGIDASEWIEKYLLDRYAAYWLSSQCSQQRIASGYVHNEAIQDAKKRKQLRA